MWPQISQQLGCLINSGIDPQKNGRVLLGKILASSGPHDRSMKGLLALGGPYLVFRFRPVGIDHCDGVRLQSCRFAELFSQQAKNRAKVRHRYPGVVTAQARQTRSESRSESCSCDFGDIFMGF